MTKQKEKKYNLFNIVRIIRGFSTYGDISENTMYINFSRQLKKVKSWKNIVLRGKKLVDIIGEN